MTTTVKTYLKSGNQFIPISDYSGTLPDENYVEGAICCTIAGQSILSRQHWDLIDQLWAYIVEGLVKLSADEVYDSSFPDQPLRLRLEPLSEYCVGVTIGETLHRVDRKTFVNTMKCGAEEFFAAIRNLCPASADTWDRYLAEVRSVKR